MGTFQWGEEGVCEVLKGRGSQEASSPLETLGVQGVVAFLRDEKLLLPLCAIKSTLESCFRSGDR